MKALISRKLALFAVAAGAVFLISAVFLLEETKSTAYHGDESGWISAGYYYADLFLRHDFDWQAWTCEPCGEWGSWLNANLGKLLIGLPLKADSQVANKVFFEFFWWNHTYEWNVAAGHIPAQDILLAARRASAVFGALTCVVVFSLGYFSGNLWIGVMAVVLLLMNQLFVDSATRAMTDVHYNFFLVSLGVPAVLLLKPGSRTRMLLVCGLFGGLAGLAGSVKESGVIVGALFFLSVVVYKWFVSHPHKKALLLYLAAFSFSAIVTIYALNPYYWPSSEQVSASAVVQEVSTLATKASSGQFDRATWRTQYPQLSNLSHVLNFPGSFVTRMNYMESDIAAGNGKWDGVRLVVLHRELLLTYASFPLELIFLGVGVVASAASMVASIKRQSSASVIVPLLFFLANYLLILVFMKVNWYRYYIPTMAAGRILVAGGIYIVAVWAIHTIDRMRQSHQSR
jgi:4-amino-4-deoxy-L-arabinose transferase-like glycosyltransferase